MAEPPDVTVVIPTRDRWPLLQRAGLRSALQQERVDVEVVVVDDGSTDETPERLAALGDPRVRVVRHERPLGVARARNAGIAEARGRWVSFLDDDDLWAPSKLAEQLAAADRADASFAYAYGAGVDSSARFLFGVAQPEPDEVLRELLRWNVIWCGCSNVAAETAVVRSLGGFDESLAQLADWDLWIRLALVGRAAVCRDILVAYTIHEASMLLTDPVDPTPELEYLARKHAEAARAQRVEIDRARFARWVAQGHRRAGRRGLAARTYLAAAVRHRDGGSAARAVGALLGERTFAAIREATGLSRRSPRPVEAPEPTWLAGFREQDR